MRVDRGLGPFVDAREEAAANTDAESLKAAIQKFYGQAIGLDDLADVLLAEYVRRCVNRYPAATDGTGQATMYDLREISSDLAIDVADEDFEAATGILESASLLSFDSAPVEVPEPHAFAYLNPGGFERGLTLIARYVSPVPASDRLVDLSHNQQTVSAAVERLQEASEVVRGSNALEPDRRQALRDQIEIGIELLKKPKVYLSAISALLLEPLYSAYCDLAEGAAKSALEAAVTAIRSLIGS